MGPDDEQRSPLLRLTLDTTQDTKFAGREGGLASEQFNLRKFAGGEGGSR
jgi:hypothetical protein